jgi:hypothetical protein
MTDKKKAAKRRGQEKPDYADRIVSKMAKQTRAITRMTAPMSAALAQYSAGLEIVGGIPLMAKAK